MQGVYPHLPTDTDDLSPETRPMGTLLYNCTELNTSIFRGRELRDLNYQPVKLALSLGSKVKTIAHPLTRIHIPADTTYTSPHTNKISPERPY